MPAARNWIHFSFFACSRSAARGKRKLTSASASRTESLKFSPSDPNVVRTTFATSGWRPRVASYWSGRTMNTGISERAFSTCTLKGLAAE